MSWTPSTRNVKLKIEGTDYTSYLLQSSGAPGGVPGYLMIDNVITRQIDQCRFGLFPAENLTIDNWDEVIITNDAEDTRYFAGYITYVAESPFIDADGNERLALGLDAQDYTCLFNKAIINREWENEDDDTIVQEIVSYATPDLSGDINTSNHVENHSTITKFRCSRVTVREALDRLAEILGADWYVDYDGELHWFITEQLSADFDLTDAPNYTTSFPHRNLKRVKPGLDIVNRVIVVGGYYLSEDTTLYLQGTGKDPRVSLPFKAHAPSGESSLQVWRNDNTEGDPTWTAMDVLTAYIQELADGNDVLHYFQEKFLEQQSNWPDLKNAVKVTGQFEIPLRVETRDDASYATYGRWLTSTINDTNLSTKEEARLRGKALLAQYSVAVPAYRCSVHEPGLKAGQTVTLVDSNLDINSTFLIQRAVTRQLPNGYVETSLNLGAFNPDLAAIIRALKRITAKDVEWRDDEVLDLLFTNYEILELSESLTFSNTEKPYTWGPGGSNDCAWGFGKWA